MNKLAVELNKVLEGTVVSRLLSDFGNRFYFPKGIASQAAEAGTHAKLYNATIGMAKENGEPMMPAVCRSLLPELSAAEAVEYAPNGGVAELRELWTNEMIRKNPALNKDKMSHPMIVAGLTNGISQVADLFIDPDDKVVIPNLFWGNYRLIFKERKGAEIVTFPFFSNGRGFNIEGFKNALIPSAGGTKLTVVLNFPNNPTGYTPTVEEAKSIRDTLVTAADSGLSLLVICDDAYFGLFFEDELLKNSFFSLISNVHPNILAVKVDGPTKEDYAWGFRIGFVTFGSESLSKAHYEAVEKKLLGSIRSSISNCSRPAQSLLVRSLGNPDYEKQKSALFEELKQRYLLVKNIVSNPRGGRLTPLPFNSGYFMSFACEGNAEQLRNELLYKKGIGTIAIQDDLLRVAYASVERDVIEPLFREIYSSAG
ncbi:MAG: aminotransferase class I/II-fold pyridoxal phosphate-dependent enzyme [Spirochaetales bacterium]|jgi:aspartate/methionine/tyrosine aminotransferase|nr:aminotransferase class I/II-fold pyridoxal phosphate-dependent enzyme [Spirochaetales bacterium]